MQRPKDAIATLQPLLQAKPTDADVLGLAASAYEADGNTPEAVRILRQAIVADPHNVNLYLDFTNLCLDHQSYQVGVDMIDAGLAADPKLRRCIWRGACFTCSLPNTTKRRPTLRALTRWIPTVRWARQPRADGRRENDRNARWSPCDRSW